MVLIIKHRRGLSTHIRSSAAAAADAAFTSAELVGSATLQVLTPARPRAARSTPKAHAEQDMPPTLSYEGGSSASQISTEVEQ